MSRKMHSVSFEGTKRRGGASVAFVLALVGLESCGPAVVPTPEAGLVEEYFGDRRLDTIEGVWAWRDEGCLFVVSRDLVGTEPEYPYVARIADAPDGCGPREEYFIEGDVVFLAREGSSESRFVALYAPNGSRYATSAALVDDRLVLTVPDRAYYSSFWAELDGRTVRRLVLVRSYADKAH